MIQRIDSNFLINTIGASQTKFYSGRIKKWDFRFLSLAKHIASWSKDPSTQVGAVIADSENRVVSVGYNGFPRGVHDTETRLNDREQKYPLTIHAEINAILFAQKGLKDTILYTWPFPPCDKCAGFIAQSGLQNVVSIERERDTDLILRWKEELKRGEQVFEESQVNLRIYTREVWQEL
ncbi:hypothetical protein LCGC14_0549640 [marine sediment metagenome]|uniref:CMP/dCMP-type deaminase domain-containing protein n=1 Tax=marine sediment metagenome TaxID=412755 RepID=A0A0F9S8R2_9ZZZZ